MEGEGIFKGDKGIDSSGTAAFFLFFSLFYSFSMVSEIMGLGLGMGNWIRNEYYE